MMELKGNCLWEYETYHKPEIMWRPAFKHQRAPLRLIYDLWKEAVQSGECLRAAKLSRIYQAMWYSI